MSRDHQLATVAAVARALPAATITAEAAPPWLVRPGKVECRACWSLVCSIYEELTGLELPDVMPPREHRRVDALIVIPAQQPRIFEFDETQHFNTC